jgi:hypothetical protein
MYKNLEIELKNKLKRKEYRLKNKEKINQQKKIFYLKNKEKIKKKIKQNYEINKDKKLLYQKQYYKNNKQKINIYNKKLRSENFEKYQKKDKEYYQLNYETKIKNKKREYMRKRRQNSLFKTIDYLKRRMLLALNKSNSIKSKKHIDLIGCSPEFLKNYLESKFKNGMTWQNHKRRGWHIDHIKPCSSFDLSKEEEQLACFHYTNLQPLWWHENLKKSNKII